MATIFFDTPGLHLTIPEEIGNGSTARVFAAQNPTTHSPWAVKVYRGDKWTDGAQREYKILREKLNNEAPHTIGVRSFIRSHDKVELCMQRLKNPDLFDLICSDRQRFTAEVFFNVAKQGLEALQFYKSKGIIHSDIKLENCSYDLETGEFKIFDFGFAFSPEEEKHRGGTLIYGAPEIFLGETFSYEIDMWAFGVTLFEIYTCDRMFQENKKNKRNAMIYQFGKQFGSPFIDYMGARIFQKKFGTTLDEVWKTVHVSNIQKAGEWAVDLLSPEEKMRPSCVTPWQDRIREIGKARREAEQAEPIIRFLEKIFTFENRMTPEEGLRTFFPKS